MLYLLFNYDLFFPLKISIILFLIDAARRNGDERSEEANRVAFELKQNREGEGSKMTFRNFFIKTFTRFAKISED